MSGPPQVLHLLPRKVSDNSRSQTCHIRKGYMKQESLGNGAGCWGNGRRKCIWLSKGAQSRVWRSPHGLCKASCARAWSWGVSSETFSVTSDWHDLALTLRQAQSCFRPGSFRAVLVIVQYSLPLFSEFCFACRGSTLTVWRAPPPGPIHACRSQLSCQYLPMAPFKKRGCKPPKFKVLLSPTELHLFTVIGMKVVSMKVISMMTNDFSQSSEGTPGTETNCLRTSIIAQPPKCRDLVSERLKKNWQLRKDNHPWGETLPAKVTFQFPRQMTQRFVLHRYRIDFVQYKS